MKVYSTRDVSLESLREFSHDAGEELGIEVDESQFTGKSSAETPSIVTLLAEITWWKAIGLAALGLASKYAYSLADSAAKEHWTKRKEIASGAAKGVRKLAAAITKLLHRSKPITIAVGLPFPDDYFSTHLDLIGADEESITVQLELFIEHLPQLQTLIEELKENKPATGIFLKLLENGSLEGYWFDGRTLHKSTRTFQLPVNKDKDNNALPTPEEK